MTAKLDPMSFARIYIEVDVSFSFPSSIKVVVFNEDLNEEVVLPIAVEYQSRPPACQACKVFGHSSLKCPKSNFQWIPRLPLRVMLSLVPCPLFRTLCRLNLLILLLIGLRACWRLMVRIRLQSLKGATHLCWPAISHLRM